MLKVLSSFLCAGLLALAVASAAWGTPKYGIFDLGPGSAYGINDASEVVGKSTNPLLYGPALWRFGLAAPMLLPTNPYYNGMAMDINNAGVVVGSAGNTGVVWYPPYGTANMVYLRGLAEHSGVYAPSGIQAVNEGGFVAGHSFSIYNYSTSGFSEMHATSWDPDGNPTDIGVLHEGNESFGFGINDAGAVVGDSDGRVFYWGGGGNTIVALDYLFPFDYSTAYDINNANQLVGYYGSPMPKREAYRLDNNQLPRLLTPLGHLGNYEQSMAYSINDASEIVGVSRVDSGYYLAFVWNDWDGMMQLDQLIHPDDPLHGLVTLDTGRAINELGWIVAEGYQTGVSGRHVFLMMPMELSAAYLTTGSPVSISQLVNTPDTPFELRFDYRFETTTGVLTVRLDGVELTTIQASPSATLQTETVDIDVPHLGKDDVVLQFELDGPTGSTVALDNIMFPGLLNGRFASGDFFGWDTVIPTGGSAGVAELVVVDELTATVDIDPDVLNVKSKGPYVTAYIELPEGYDPAEIDLTMLAITMVDGAAMVIPAEESPVHVGDHDRDAVIDLMVKFSRPALLEVAEEDHMEITVSGSLEDGTPFVGNDTVQVRY